MTLQHSSGPWKATGNGVHTGIHCVATTHAEPREQRQIDARLIAAAPDMLRLLRVFAVPITQLRRLSDGELRAALEETAELVSRLDGGE